MKYKACLLLVSLWVSASDGAAQSRMAPKSFAHNDYVHARPFIESYSFQVDYIEADVFHENNQLLVAHTRQEIRPSRTLEVLYLNPLDSVIARNDGFAYADTTEELTLMIDIKSEGLSTVEALASFLKNYPALISCPTLTIVISGNVPEPDLWKSIPSFIHIDGRPGKMYTGEQLKRVALVSDSFGLYSHWTGQGAIPDGDRQRIIAVREKVWQWKKPLRFWGTTDNESVWQTLLELDLDVIGTDDVARLSRFLRRR